MRWLAGIVLLTMFALVNKAPAQLPTYGVGRTPTAAEIQAVDTAVGPSGRGLPAGHGSAKEGAPIFEKKCAHCHGVNGESDGKFPALSGQKARLVEWPFATTVWDFINNAMPRRVPDIG